MDNVDICQVLDMTRKRCLCGRELAHQNRTWWTGALGQTSLNVLYGDKFMISPILGPYFVLSATQTAVSVAVSYVFQVVSYLLRSLRDGRLMFAGRPVHRQFRSQCQGTKGRIIGGERSILFVRHLTFQYAVITIVGTVVEITGTIGSGRFWHIVAG
jgi:hypothetical protein